MPKQAKIVDARPGGENEHGEHRVLSIEGGKFCARPQPCPKCPWRVDAVGQFPAEAFRQSASTAYDMATNMFSCHDAGAKKPATCAGFLLRGADHNMAVRMKVVMREFSFAAVSDGGHELFESYRAMAIANGVPEDDPVIEPCRED